jgi:hypothetical protein
MTTRNVKLEPAIRGATFKYATVLQGGWTVEQFSGGLFFAVRRSVPPSTIVDDRDALARASSAVGGGIVGSGTAVEVTIAALVTRFWPVEELLWELRGVINGSPPVVHPIAMGTVPIVGDISRSS